MNCFGDFVTRGGLDARTRELLTFSMLLTLGGCEPQLQGAYPRQPEPAQRQTDAADRHHAAAALRGLSAVAQRGRLPE